MKSTKNIVTKLVSVVVFVAIVMVAASCEDLLEEQPISEIGAEDFYKTSSDAFAGLMGVYDAMQPAFRLNHYRWGELRSDNFGPGSESANAADLELIFNSITPGNAGPLRWDDFYILINRVNLLIENVPNISGVDSNILGEAYAIRAFAYFHAIRVWGAVPLYRKPIKGPDDDILKTRTDANTILDLVIIPDMLRAEELITQIQQDYRFSKTSLWALQAEVYMWLKQYGDAKEVLDKIVDSNEFSLVGTPEDWQNLFLNDIGDGSGPMKVMEGPELIFSLAFNINESRDSPGQTRANRGGVFTLFYAGLPSYHISSVLENKWVERFPTDSLGWVTKYPNIDPPLTQVVEYLDDQGMLQDSIAPVYGDFRFYYSREGGFRGLDTRLPGEARLAKYNKSNYSADLDDSDIVMYRYAGMLLLLAEAENRLGNKDRALELVNQIRTARQLPLVLEAEFGASVEDRENYLLDERQFELLGEGKRWWDLRRTDKAIEVLNPILAAYDEGVALTAERLLWPIWETHLLENPNLEPNPGF